MNKKLIFNFGQKKKLNKMINDKINLNREEIRRKEIDNISKVLKCVLVLCVKDEFNCAPEKIKSFLDKFDLQMDCINENYVSFEDYAEECKKIGINL